MKDTFTSSRKPRVLVAMSGGVDSSVTAALLVRRGYPVVGVTMQIWQEHQTDPRHAGCCSLGAVEDARRVASRLGIPYYVVNFREEFRQTVIEDFVTKYSEGLTPNPCVECNRHIKFDLLLRKADEIGCELLATGHYARVRWDARRGRWRLLRARDKSKDQSYALYMLSQETLARVRFPLGEFPTKAETRRMASEWGLPVAQKPESQDICFVREAGGYGEFVRKYKPHSFTPGEIVDAQGRVLGRHGGVALYTIGQRRRLGLNVDGKPLFVLRVDPRTNRVVVGREEELYTSVVYFEDVVGFLRKPEKVVGKVRYGMEPQPAIVYPGVPARAEFLSPVRAVTPGQSAVFYAGETVVAGGIILAPDR